MYDRGWRIETVAHLGSGSFEIEESRPVPRIDSNASLNLPMSDGINRNIENARRLAGAPSSKLKHVLCPSVLPRLSRGSAQIGPRSYVCDACGPDLFQAILLLHRLERLDTLAVRAICASKSLSLLFWQSDELE